MDKKICDFCGKDITNDEIFDIGIYDKLLEKETYQRDACRECKNKIRTFLNKFKK